MKIRALLWLQLIILSTNLYAASDAKLIFAMDIIRHGDRTPIHLIPNAPHDWPQGLGQLTATGMQQEYQLGVKARKNYITDTQLLPPTFVSETLYARSSDVDRTLMSAQSFLMGLYPPGTGPQLPDSNVSALPGGYQPIPIHTVPKDQETLLNATSDTAQLQTLCKRYVYSTPEWKAKEAALKPKFAAWSEILGIKITQLYQLKSIGDTLTINQLYHLPLPAGLSQEDANQLMDIAHWVFITTYKNPTIGRIEGGALLKAIAEDIKIASEEKSPLKYKLISAHDSNLLSVMSAMKAPLNTPPHYASDLNVRLYQSSDGVKTVTLTFNDEPVNLPACGGNTCTLNQFFALAKQS